MGKRIDTKRRDAGQEERGFIVSYRYTRETTRDRNLQNFRPPPHGMVLSSLRVHTLPSGNLMPVPIHSPVNDSPLPSFWSKSMKMDASSLAILALIVHGLIFPCAMAVASFFCVEGFSFFLHHAARPARGN